MCGILGFVDKRDALSHSERERVIKAMVSTIEHRGRDGSGTFVEGKVALGNVRLSILDLTSAAAQPFSDESGSFILSYNGELYNYRALNAELEKTHRLRSSSDTETLLYRYIDDPDGYLSQLQGMFGFSLFDKERRRLVLAVDRFSIKPLYYIDTPEWFAWSSEVKAFRELPGFSASLAREHMSEFVQFRQVAGAQTLFSGVRRVLPAEELRFDLVTSRLSARRYWHLSAVSTPPDGQAALRSLLTRSVEEHLLSDVPVGLQLSGGVDSSLVAALAVHAKPGLHTYSIGLLEKEWNEFPYSRAVAKDLGTVHHELLFTEEDFCRALPLLTYMHDEPISHSHSVPMHLLAKRARQDVKVLLSGEGADEVFLGYKRYPALLAKRLSERDVVYSNAFVGEAEAKSIVRDFDSDTSTRSRYELLREAGDSDDGRRLSYYDLMTYLPPLLMRQDKMGMAANLENRVPFLDHRVVEFGYSLPRERKVQGSEAKVLLKEIAAEVLPRELVYRPKCGFGQPVAAWLKNPRGLRRYLRLFDDGAVPEAIEYEALRQAADEHARGVREHTELLWTLINFELWMRICVRGETPADVLRFVSV